MSTFTVSVSERPAVRLFGLFVRTNMDKAPVDCHNIWEKVFGPRMPEISGKKPEEYHGPSYGVSIMLDEHNFNYWAAMPAPAGRSLPEGMLELNIPSGLYAHCLVPSLAQIKDAYMHIYTVWPQSAKEYSFNMQAPCFEYYDNKFCESGAFEVCAPVVKI